MILSGVTVISTTCTSWTMLMHSIGEGRVTSEVQCSDRSQTSLSIMTTSLKYFDVT